VKGRGDPKGLHLVHPHPRIKYGAASHPPPSEGRECPYNYGLINKRIDPRDVSIDERKGEGML